VIRQHGPGYVMPDCDCRPCVDAREAPALRAKIERLTGICGRLERQYLGELGRREAAERKLADARERYGASHATAGRVAGAWPNGQRPRWARARARREAEMNCPTCKQNMNDGPREGWQGVNCPDCGQGLKDARHVRAVLMRQSKAKPAGRVRA